MQFGVFWWLSEPLSWSLNKLQSILGSYGLAIIALTILVKLLLWPLTAKATRSQKKMQALQGPMGKLKEKHKEPAKAESGDDEVLQGKQGQPFCGMLAHPHPNPHFPKHVLDVALCRGTLWARVFMGE